MIEWQAVSKSFGVVPAVKELSLTIAPGEFVVLIGASCSFLSPIGYQTNLMVYGLGGYKFRDFTLVGLPLTLVTLIVTPIVVPLVLGL